MISDVGFIGHACSKGRGRDGGAGVAPVTKLAIGHRFQESYVSRSTPTNESCTFILKKRLCFARSTDSG
jgi:hypothetical protein